MKIHLSGKKYRSSTKKILMLAAGLLPALAFAKGPKAASEVTNPVAIAMIAIAVILLLAIYITSRLLIQQAKTKVERFKKEQKENLAKAGSIVLILFLCFLSSSLFAQDAGAAIDAAAQAAVAPAVLSDGSFYALCAVIAAELIILLGLLSQLQAMMKEETVKVAGTSFETTVEAVAKESSFKKWWQNINKFKPIQEEASIDLGHDYDGIRELDNRLPPWWLYGFYLCIIFACVYLWRTEVSHSAPSTIEEYRASVAEAAVAKEAYLAKSKSSVDESSVKFLTGTPDIESGKKIFTTVCAACHLADGGGIVGPNLTDDYWIHGGSIQDIFKTIKYGWPEKGMKSWKDDYSPLQIAQLSSFVKSLHGIKPATPKEPQGELYKEDNTSAPAKDSLKKDSAKVSAFIH